MEHSSPVFTIGQILIRAREQKHWTQEQAAKSLNMQTNTIRALEQNDFASIPQIAFLKGYLRSYAKLLDLDADEIIQQFNQEYLPEAQTEKPLQVSSTKPIKITLKQNKKKGTKKWLLAVGGTITLCLVAFGYQYVKHSLLLVKEGSHNETLRTSTWKQPLALFNNANNMEASHLQNTSSKDQKSSKLAAQINNPSSSNIQMEVNLPPSTDVKKVTIFTPDNAGHAEPSLDRINLTFNGPAQVTIKDAEGQTLYSGNKEGAPVSLQGIAPFSLKIKGTSNVKLQLNGQPVDLNLYSVSGQADFRLSR